MGARAISVAQLMVVLDATIANIALPFIQNDLDISQANLQWVVTGYALAFGGLLLLGGRLGDLYGRRRIFMLGVTIFAIASGIGGLAQSEMHAARLEGTAGCGGGPRVTGRAGPDHHQLPGRTEAQPGLLRLRGDVRRRRGGGPDPRWLADRPEPRHPRHQHRRMAAHVPDQRAHRSRRRLLAPRVLAESESHPGELDLPGAITGTAGLIGLVFGLSRAGNQRYGWDDPWTIASLAAGLLLLVVFVLIERRVQHPLLPFRILTNRTRATAFATMMIVPAAMFAMFFFLSLFVQNVMGYSPLHTGFAFLPFSFGIVLGAALSSRLMAKVDPRWIAGVGTIMAGTALLMFSQLSVDDSPPTWRRWPPRVVDISAAPSVTGATCSRSSC